MAVAGIDWAGWRMAAEALALGTPEAKQDTAARRIDDGRWARRGRLIDQVWAAVLHRRPAAARARLGTAKVDADRQELFLHAGTADGCSRPPGGSPGRRGSPATRCTP